MFNVQRKFGATRNALLIGNIVIKVPRFRSWKTFLNGILANLTEREFSTMNSPYLAKVYYADIFGLMLIMERADKVLRNTTKNTNAFFEKCEEEGLPVDWNPWNIGVFGKDWKLIDYGN